MRLTILIFTLLGFALRLHYLITTHPFFDEYTTVLAARQILRYGWPILPSGLFYEHGLLSTFIIAPFLALFIDMPLAHWQPAHWGLMLARWPSVLIGTATIPLIYAIGRRCWRGQTSHNSALLAAGLFALSPEGMVWGGRARMYALATLLVLLTVYWAYRGALYPAPAKYRWWALAALLATLLTQFGAMMLIPALVVGMLVVGWFSWRNSDEAIALSGQNKAARSLLPAARPWILRATVFGEGFALAAIVGLASWVKRLGQPLGVAALDNSGLDGNLLIELFDSTIAYQTAFHFTWPDTTQFLARQFGVPHHFWLTILALIGTVIGLILYLTPITTVDRRSLAAPGSPLNSLTGPPPQAILRQLQPTFCLFLWLVFGLLILEMVTLLEPFRRNPRYLVMYLPLFYLIVAWAIFNFLFLPQLIFRLTPHVSRFTSSPLIVIVLLLFLTTLGLKDLEIALSTPEPAYEEAFAWLEANRRPDDVVLTMNTPAAGLYLGQADGFTVQEKAEQFLLNRATAPVDRWLGAPWLGRAADFNVALDAGPQAWFVIDTIRQPVYFRGDWLAVVYSQMEQVWAKDNALIYRTRPDRFPIPTQPDTLIKATLNDSIQLTGYTLSLPPHPTNRLSNQQTNHPPPKNLHLTLFWQSLTTQSGDYTIFLHLRNQAGDNVAQGDRQPLAGVYPTSQWQPGETVIDPILWQLPEDVPPGRYHLFTGLYQLDTLERLPVANDASGENAILLGEVRLP